MGLVGDTRGQSIWIGAMLLLGVVMLNFALYQTTVVPEQNADAEFAHDREMVSEMRGLRDSIAMVGHTGGTQTASFDLGPEYPPRLFALNPPPPTGTLRTTTAGEISVTTNGSAANLSAACGYGGKSIETRSLAYRIDYNSYAPEPRLVYSQSALYRETNEGQHLLAAEQSLVTNDTITLVPLTSEYSRASTQSVSLELVAGPVGRMTVYPNGTTESQLSLRVNRSAAVGRPNASATETRPNATARGPRGNASRATTSRLSLTATEPVVVRFPSRLDAAGWRALLADQPAVSAVREDGDQRIAVELSPDRPYTVVCYPVGLGAAPPTGVRTLGSP